LAEKPSQDSFSDEEIGRRRDEAVRRALNTPPQPKKAKPKNQNESIKSKKSAPKRRGKSP